MLNRIIEMGDYKKFHRNSLPTEKILHTQSKGRVKREILAPDKKIMGSLSR